MPERKLIQLVCVLRDYIGKSVAILAYRDYESGCVNILASEGPAAMLCELLAENCSVYDLGELQPENCFILTGIVYGAEDLPCDLGPNEEALVLLNGIDVFKANSIEQVTKKIEKFMATDLTKSMGSMAVVIGYCKTIAAVETFLERARRLRKMYNAHAEQMKNQSIMMI